MTHYPTTTSSRRGERLPIALLSLCLLSSSAALAVAQDRNSARSAQKPAIRYLAALPAESHGERVLSELFHAGTADEIPIGISNGYPVLFHSLPELNWLASQLWGGKHFRKIGESPEGEPIVRLDNQIIRTDTGSVFSLFDAYVTKSPVGKVFVGQNDRKETVPAPAGTLAPVQVSFLHDSVAIDDKPSIVLNYFEDESLPIIRRIFDEIREVDAEACPGVYLGRAHVRRCTSLSCAEIPDVLVDTPEEMTFRTRYEWAFWTYFLLDFTPGSSCDLAPALERARQQLAADGISVSLPPPPAP
jgi:hypothetical protein